MPPAISLPLELIMQANLTLESAFLADSHNLS